MTKSIGCVVEVSCFLVPCLWVESDVMKILCLLYGFIPKPLEFETIRMNPIHKKT